MNKKILESRLIEFAVQVMVYVKDFEIDAVNSGLIGQITRSSSSAALNYGEAESAESRKDFIHKIGIVMKELRETYINLSLISKVNRLQSEKGLEALKKENDELIAIFYKTLQTAKMNLNQDLSKGSK